uniref:RNase H type-1 domain-containing protein n=1 Tax=Chenopodium quinoa TaxID=63459 RepID=A0A803M2Q5_CHEQI
MNISKVPIKFISTLRLSGVKVSGFVRALKKEDEAWLPGVNACVVPTPNINSSTDLKVSDLIDRDNACWEMGELHTHLSEEDIALVQRIPLSCRWSNDLHYWRPTPDGVLCFLKLVEDFREYNTSISSVAAMVRGGAARRGVVSRNGWVRPAPGMVRVNSDAIVFSGVGVGLGLCIRDERGKLLVVGVRRVVGDGTVRLAEALAAR